GNAAVGLGEPPRAAISHEPFGGRVNLPAAPILDVIVLPRRCGACAGALGGSAMAPTASLPAHLAAAPQPGAGARGRGRNLPLDSPSRACGKFHALPDQVCCRSSVLVALAGRAR